MLPVLYARQQPRAAPAEPRLSHHFINSQYRARCSFRLLFHPNTLCDFRCQLLDFFWIFFGLDCYGPRLPLTSAAASTAPSTSASSLALDSAARRSCTKCSRRISSYSHDKHSLCLHCRDVLCSLDTRCRECSSWSTDKMLE